MKEEKKGMDLREKESALVMKLKEVLGKETAPELFVDFGFGDSVVIDDVVYASDKNAIELKVKRDLFVDCGQGDKFIIEDVNCGANNRSLEFKINKSSLKWIEMDVKHPIKLTNN